MRNGEFNRLLREKVVLAGASPRRNLSQKFSPVVSQATTLVGFVGPKDCGVSVEREK